MSKIQTNFKYLKALLTSLLVILLWPDLLTPSGLASWSATDLGHPWASAVNPALISWQNSRVSLGHKVFHLGFLPDNSMGIRESHINASFPYYLPFSLGVGLDLQYFAAGIYTEFLGSMLFSKEVFRRFSLGFKLGLEQRAFAKENFVLVDNNDPLLSKTLNHLNMNLGCGFYWNPGRFTLGLGVDHLNRPNIAVQANAPIAQEISGAIGYDFGWLRPAIQIHDQGEGVQFGFTVSTHYRHLGFIRLTFENNMPIHLEASLPLSKVSSLHYGYHLPGEYTREVSFGSHELVFSYILGQEPDITQPNIVLSKQKVNILEETVIRSMTSGLVPERIEKLSDLAPEFLDASRKPQDLLIYSAGSLHDSETTETRHQRFVQIGAEIKALLQQNPDLKVFLRAENGARQDAQELRQYLVSHEGISSEKIALGKLNTLGGPKLIGFTPGRQIISQKKPEITEEKLVIQFTSPGKMRRLKNWCYTIVNHEGKKVKSFTGKDRLPEYLEWNWQSNDGELVNPGYFSGILNLEAMSGKNIVSRAPVLRIDRIKRTVQMRFDSKSRRPQPVKQSNEVAEKLN